MAEQNDPMAEVTALLEAEPKSSPAPDPDIPALREQLSVLVSTGKCKEAIGVNLTHDQVKRLEDKDVMRHIKRYETYVGEKTTGTLIENIMSFYVKALSMVVEIKDPVTLKNELKNNYITTKELTDVWFYRAEMWPSARVC